jgi:hypothetical protein
MVPLTVATALISALLAFLIEPHVGKLLLPTYGGAAAVWTTALVFFQVSLLTGYALAHVVIRWLGLRRAALVEIVVVGLPLLALPVALPVGAAAPSGVAPAPWLLGVLAVTVGAPFVALATATPTLQRWLAATGGPRARAGAVRLFAASNVGSLLGLLAYPTLVEPNLDLDDQARLWAFGYAAFFALIVAGAVVVLRRAPPDGARTASADRPPSRSTRLEWVGLAAVPAALVVGTTAQLTIDVAAVPLLWVVPLAIYLSTFVLAFAGARPIGLRVANLLLPPLALGVAISVFAGAQLPVWAIFGVSLGALACAGVVCHGRLAIARPTPERLTEYDLAIAAGGALGGLLAGVVAPIVLPVPLEGPIALVVALGLRWGSGPLGSGESDETDDPAEARPGPSRPWIGPLTRTPFLLRYVLVSVALVVGLAWLQVEIDTGVLLAVLVLGLLLPLARWPIAFAAAVVGVFVLSLIAVPPALESVRTFYGERRVVEDGGGRHGLLAGTTVQGIQHFRQMELRTEPIGYYYRGGPLADVIGAAQATSPSARIDVVGLGVGALAALGRPTDSLIFIEIDPAVVAIARDPGLFTYLADATASTEIVVGDGRLGLASRPGASADLIVIDAFNSDAVPVHLLTREAIELYLDRLRAGGIVAFNVSNRFVDLEPVLAASARDLGLSGLARVDEPSLDLIDADSSHVVVLARSTGELAGLAGRPGWRTLVQPADRAWTDRYSDLLGALLAH